MTVTVDVAEWIATWVYARQIVWKSDTTPGDIWYWLTQAETLTKTTIPVYELPEDSLISWHSREIPAVLRNPL